jgi:hypothetical protein
MGKYLIIIGITLFCCSFNICEKKAKVDGKISRVYIYPDCDDTSTYLKQRYQANHIVEYLYVNSKLQYKRILDKAGPWIVNEFSYGKPGGETHRTDTFAGTVPDKSFGINDSCSLNIEYFGDGGYHICTYGYDRHHECAHQADYASSIVFDSLYKSKMVGSLQIICDSNSLTDAFTNEEFVKIVHRERQVGMWYSVREDNMRIDSTKYDAQR